MPEHEGKELRRYVKDTGKTQDEFAESLGMTRQNLNVYFLKQELPQDFKKLLDDKGHLLFSKALTTMTNPKPLYDMEGTAGALAVFQQEKPEYIEAYIDVPQFSDCDFYIRVYGNSMYNRYCNGDIVACREMKDKRVIPYGEAYLIAMQEHRMIKYIHPGKKAHELILKSEHEDYEPFTILRDDIIRLYIIKGKITRNII